MLKVEINSDEGEAITEMFGDAKDITFEALFLLASIAEELNNGDGVSGDAFWITIRTAMNAYKPGDVTSECVKEKYVFRHRKRK